MRYVRQRHQQCLHGFLNFTECRLGLIQALAQITDFRQQGCNVFAGGLGLTDGLGFDVALVLQVFGLLLQTLALFFEADKSSDVEVIALDSQRLSNLFWVAAQQLDI